MSATQPADKGNRITTFHVALTIDAMLHRYVSVAAEHGMEIIGRIESTRPVPDIHEIQLGNANAKLHHAQWLPNEP